MAEASRQANCQASSREGVAIVDDETELFRAYELLFKRHNIPVVRDGGHYRHERRERIL